MSKPPAEWTRRDWILASVADLASSFMYYDRKEDEDLPRGAIEEAVAAGEISTEEIVEEFKVGLRKRGLETD